MRSTARRTTWSIGLVAVLLLALSALVAPAEAATARKLTVKASTTQTYVGSAVTFSGKVTKSGKGAVVKLQRQSGATWVAAGQARTTASGSYTAKVTLPVTAAAYVYRAVAPKTSKLAAATSAKVTVTALRRTTAKLSAGASSVTAGSPVTLSGTVSPFVTGSSVTVQKLASGSWVTATTATLSASGTFSKAITPTESTSYRLAVARTGLNAAAQSAAVAVAVTPAAAITTTSLPDAARGTAYSKALTHTGGAGTWSVVGSLPKGLTLNAGTGVLSGVPSAGPGSYVIYPVFTETSSGTQAAAALTLVVTGPALAITTTALPDGNRGVPYSVTLTKTGLPGQWAAATRPDGSSGLPAGLTLDPATGVLSGTPTVAGDFPVYVVYTETATGAYAFQGFALHLVDSPVITTASVPDAITGTAYSTQLTQTGGAGTWTLKQGSLPAGITLSPAGVLSGTTTKVGDYGFTVTYTETSTGNVDNQPLLLHVEAPNSPHINTTELPAGKVGTAYSAALSAVGTGTWSVIYNSLPPGITLNSATGALTGTPNTAADYIFIVKFTTATGSNTKALFIHVAP